MGFGNHDLLLEPGAYLSSKQRATP
jgi:hypothetical protein